MKKYAWLVAMLLALSLAFFSCGDEDNGKDNGGTGWTTGERAPVAEDLGCNGDNDDESAIVYQNIYKPTWLFQGRKISAGDQFTLAITYKLSKDADLIRFGFIDEGENAWNPWWGPLTKWEEESELTGAVQGVFEDIEADTDKTVLIRFTAAKTASANGPGANGLFIQIERNNDSCESCHHWACGNAQQYEWGNSCPCDAPDNDCDCVCANDDIDISFSSLKIWEGHGNEPTGE